jgi:hypothetical protein
MEHPPDGYLHYRRWRRRAGAHIAGIGTLRATDRWLGIADTPLRCRTDAETRAHFAETAGAARPYTTNGGFLKQPDKHKPSKLVERVRFPYLAPGKFALFFETRSGCPSIGRFIESDPRGLWKRRPRERHARRSREFQSTFETRLVVARPGRS